MGRRGGGGEGLQAGSAPAHAQKTSWIQEEGWLLLVCFPNSLSNLTLVLFSFWKDD